MNGSTTPQKVGKNVVVRVPEKVYMHTPIRVNSPADGYQSFVCSVAPKSEIHFYETLYRCPLCKKINPTGEGR